MALINIARGNQPESQRVAWQESFLRKPQLYVVEFNSAELGNLLGKITLVGGYPPIFSIPTVPSIEFKYLKAALINEKGEKNSFASDEDSRLRVPLIFDFMAYQNIGNQDNPEKDGKLLTERVFEAINGSIDHSLFRAVISQGDRAKFSSRSVAISSEDNKRVGFAPSDQRERAKFLIEAMEKLGPEVQIKPVNKNNFIQSLNELL